MRYSSIDVLRGLAILLMIQTHFVENLSSRTDVHAWLYDLSTRLGMIPAPLFTLVSGASYSLWLRKQEAVRRRDADITWITLRRGAFLFALGMVFNVAVWLPEGTFNWDILTLIGTSLLLLAFARHLPPGVLVLICVMVLLLSPILRVASDYDSVWNLGDYDYDFTFEDVVSGFFVNGYFPLFPWIVFPFMGFLVSDALFPRPGRTAPFPWWVASTGVALIALASAGLLCQGMPGPLGKHYLTGLTMYPASTCYVIGMLGLGMLGLLLLRRWVDQSTRITGTGRLLEFFRLFSAFSLTVYVLHHLVHVWPLWLYGAWMQNDPTHYWRTAVDTPTALLLALACIVVFYFGLRFLDRHPRYGLESLMRRVCDY